MGVMNKDFVPQQVGREKTTISVTGPAAGTAPALSAISGEFSFRYVP